MAMRGKVRNEGGRKRRMRSKLLGSDGSDDDYNIGDDELFDDSDEYCSSLAGEESEENIGEFEDDLAKVNTGKLKRRNGFVRNIKRQVGKALKASKVSYKEDSDEDYVDEDEDDKYLHKSLPSRNKDGFKKAPKKKKASYTEESDDDYEAEDDECDDDDFDKSNRKQNGVKKALKKREASDSEEDDDNYVAENDECDDSDYEEHSRKQNKVQKTPKKQKASNMENNDDDHEAEDEDDECHDIDYDEPSSKQNNILQAPRKKKGSDTEEDDDYETEEDECDDDDFEVLSMKQNVQKAPKKKKYPSSEEDDDDYKAEDDECGNDDDFDDYDDEDEDDDEDFSPDEIDFDDEDEFAVIKKMNKVKRPCLRKKRSFRGRKKKMVSRVLKKSNSKKTSKRRGQRRKTSSVHRGKATKVKPMVIETPEKNVGARRRRLMLDSDSDFVDTGRLDHEYTISEEEREQVREASEFCGHADASLRTSSLKKRPREEENLHEDRKHKKGKFKLDDSKKEIVKQVCGICFSEEGKRTIRGTLNCCSHYFCFTCIMEWSKVESRCPLCKQRFVTISKPAKLDAAFDSRTIIVPVPERDQVYQPSEEELRAYIDPYENVICTECHNGGDDANMLLCDLCDSPSHTYCVGLSAVPEGNWYCEGCRPTALGFSNPQEPNSTRDQRTTNDLSERSSPSENNIREAIDLNRVYEPETPLAQGYEMSSSPRHVDGAPPSGPSTGVRTVSETRMRHRIAQMSGGTGGISLAPSWNYRVRPQSEWGRTRRLGFQDSANGELIFRSTYSQGGLRENFTSSPHNTHHLSANLTHSRGQRVWGQSFTDINSSSDGTLQAGLAGVSGSSSRSVHGHSSLQ